MRKFELPKIEVRTFNKECVVTESGIETTDAMTQWQTQKNGIVKKIDYTLDLVKFTY